MALSYLENMKSKRLNTNYDLELEVITPLHIGTATEKKWLKHIDYFYQNGYLYIIAPDKLYNHLQNIPGRRKGETTGLDTYTRLLSRGQLDKIEKYFQEEDIPFSKIYSKRFHYHADIPSEIKPNIRTGMGTPMIPGSSIKGAIKSVLFNYLYRKTFSRGSSPTLDQELLGHFDRSIMRFIRPYDAEIKETEIVDIELFNLYNDGGMGWESDFKDRFNVSVESFKPEAKGNFRLSIANGLIAVIEQEEKKVDARQAKKKLLPTHIKKIIKGDDPAAFLFEIINQYTKTHIKKEIDFFNKYNQLEDTDEVIEQLESMIADIDSYKDHKKCILRMAYGSGFHAITGDWRFRNHLDTINNPDRKNLTSSQSSGRQPARYKSRNLADNGDMIGLMGFVRLGRK